MSSGWMSLNFCCQIWIVGLENGVNDIKACCFWCNVCYVLCGGHTLGPLVASEDCLNVTAYLDIVAKHVHHFSITLYFSSDGCFSRRTTVISVLRRGPQSPDLSQMVCFWDVVKQKSQITSCQQNLDQNLWEIFAALCWIYTRSSESEVWR